MIAMIFVFCCKEKKILELLQKLISQYGSIFTIFYSHFFFLSNSNRLRTNNYFYFLFFHIELTLLMWTSIIIIMSCKVTFQEKFTKVSNYSIFGLRHICLCLLSYGDVPSYYTKLYEKYHVKLLHIFIYFVIGT